MRTSGVDNGIISFSFNQDASLLALGTKEGTLWYKVHPFELLRRNREDAAILTMHYKSDLVAQVGAAETATSSQRCLRMLNARQDKEITKRHFATTVLDVLLNSDRVVVVLECSIYVYNLADMKLLHTIEAIPHNPNGVCALPALQQKVSGSLNMLAYPNNSTGGHVHIYDVINLRAGVIIEAHTSPVRCLSFNDSGTILATSSTKGTVIRVFSIPNGDKLYEFRRGLATNARIFSMAFDLESRFLCVSSDHPTIHIFKLGASAAREPSKSEGWSATGLFQAAVQTATTYLPTPMSDMLTQSRSFAQISLPRAGNPCLCAITGIAPALQVLVATSEGILYEFRLDAESGGDCERLAGYPLCSSATNLLDMSESRGAASAGTAGDGDDSASPGTAEGATATEPTEPAPDAAAAAP